MRRFAALLAAFALAFLCAGGFAMSEAAPTGTLPPFRHILDISFSVSPAELVDPGTVTLTFTITNSSDYDAENVYISSADGLRTEPLGQIDAGDSRVYPHPRGQRGRTGKRAHRFTSSPTTAWPATAIRQLYRGLPHQTRHRLGRRVEFSPPIHFTYARPAMW